MLIFLQQTGEWNTAEKSISERKPGEDHTAFLSFFFFFVRYILLVEKIILWDVCGQGSPIVWKAAKGTEVAVHNSYGPLLQLELEI